MQVRATQDVWLGPERGFGFRSAGEVFDFAGKLPHPHLEPLDEADSPVEEKVRGKTPKARATSELLS